MQINIVWKICNWCLEFISWIQLVSATLGSKEFRRSFKSETFSRTVIEPVFDL
jgi:hypothetical protein